METGALKTVGRNFLAVAVGQGAAGLLYFLTLTRVAQRLGPACFGQIGFAESTLMYFVVLVNQGLDLWGTREIARLDTAGRRRFIGGVLVLRGCLAAIAFALLGTFVLILKRSLESEQLVLLYGASLFPLALSLGWVFQGVERMAVWGAAQVIRELAFATLVLTAVREPSDLLWVGLFYALSRVVMSGFLLLSSVASLGIIPLTFDLSLWKRAFVEASPIALSQILVFAIYNFGISALGVRGGDTEVGYYSASYRISAILMLLFGAYYTAIFPRLSIYYSSAQDSLEKLLTVTTKVVVTLVVPIVVGGWLVGAPLIGMLYGSGYAEAVGPFRLLAAAMGLALINGVYGKGLLACDEQNKCLRVLAVQSTVSILLCLLLTPRLGANGAAAAALAGEITGLLLYHREFRVVRIRVVNYLLKPLAAVLLMGLFLVLCHQLNVVALVLLGGAVYGLAFLLLGGISSEEARLIKSLFRS